MESKSHSPYRLWRAVAAAAIFGWATAPVALAQPAPPAGSAAAPAANSGMATPGFWDPRRRPERPDLARITLIRFMTEIDYPPFNYSGPDGNPIGFNVDLARMICEELKIACTVQMRRFDTLLPSLNENKGDAVMASISVTAETRKLANFTHPYYRTPARFVGRRSDATVEVRPEKLEGKTVGVIGGSAHEAYLKALFTEVITKPYESADQLRDALRKSEIDLLFGDGIALAYWLNGADSKGCCAFRGGPFTESHYFGEGVGIAVRRGNDPLRLGFDWAMFRLWEKGRFSDLWLRYFPISPF